MLNKTKSKIVIKMNHVDNANRLYACLRSVLKNGGGDLEISVNGTKYFIGHDVVVQDMYHMIDGINYKS